MERFKHLLLAREEHPAGEDFKAREVRIAQADQEVASLGLLLGRRLVPHLAAFIQRLILVPDGPLDSIPFAALSRTPGRWLVQDYEISTEPSASVALALASEHGAAATKIAVFADPVYNRNDPRLKAASRSGTELPVAGDRGDAHLVRAMSTFDVNGLPRLTGAAKEAAAIADIAGPDRVRLYEGFRATPGQVTGAVWQGFAVVHFATHTIVDFERPELSGIVLSTLDAKGQPQDGILWMNDIYRTAMPVSLVMVDGCRTANGKSIPSEGITGIAQAFLASGASGVIGSLWTVDDEASSALVPALYRGLLQKKMSAPAALRAAQLKLIADRVYKSPYDWAGFLFEGNGQLETGAPFH
jgi:CHAT domain-containing protein